MNTETGYVSSALIRPLIEAAGIFFFDQLSEDDSGEMQTVLKQLRDPNSRIDEKAANQLISLLVRHSNNESLCVQSSQRFNVHSSCQLQHLFLCCNSLREALYYLEKFSTLLRSEEHTSELQSRPHLVCRLLLETKNNNSSISHTYCKFIRSIWAFSLL